jgi:hypothetical protein
MGDGYQQIQDPCAAQSNFIENYNDTETYMMYQIFLDPVTKGYKLHMFEADGTPVAPQFQVATSPNMLPTQPLRNVTALPTTSAGLTTQNALAVNNGQRRWSLGGTMGVVTIVFGAGLATLLL